MRSHSLAWKKKSLDDLKIAAREYPIIAFANMSGTQASLFQEVRKNLHPRAIMKVSKTRVIRKALLDAGFDATQLGTVVSGQVAVIFSKMEPFELYSIIKKSKLRASVKVGMLAPMDIMVPEGDTGLPPGPALSELKGAGLPAQIKGASIHIVKDHVIAKQGQLITPQIAGALSKLDIKPLKVGLNVVAAIEKGALYASNVLDVDEEHAFTEFVTAYTQAFNLAFEIQWVAQENIELFIQKAVREARTIQEELAKTGESSNVPSVASENAAQ